MTAASARMGLQYLSYRVTDSSVCTCRTVEPAVRSNLVIAIGDLAFRFPNLLEPWTPHMYRSLADSDTGTHEHATQKMALPALCYQRGLPTQPLVHMS